MCPDRSESIHNAWRRLTKILTGMKRRLRIHRFLTPSSNRPDVQIIKPPNTLTMARTGKNRFTPIMQAIKRSQAAIRTIGDDFANWEQSDLDELDKALAADRTNPN